MKATKEEVLALIEGEIPKHDTLKGAYEAVTKALNDAGKVNSRGKEWGWTAIKAIHERHEKESDQSEQNTSNPKPVKSDQSNPSEDQIASIVQAKVDEALKGIPAMIADKIHEEMKNMMVPTVPTVNPVDEYPPPAPRADRKSARRFKKVGVTVDENVFARFDEEIKSSGRTASSLLEMILWNRYGKPELSYQTEPTDQKEQSEDVDLLDPDTE
jgi:uncharacterized FlaG/YvyC family protein